MKRVVLKCAVGVSLAAASVVGATGSSMPPSEDPRIQDLSQLAAAVELQPNHVEAHLNLVIGLLLQGRNSEALQAVDTALVIWPDEAVLHANRAVAYLRMDRPDLADTAIEAALNGKQTPRVSLSAQQQAELHARHAWELAARDQPLDAARQLDQANARSGDRYVSDAMRLRASRPSSSGLADLLRMQVGDHENARTVALARTYRALGRTADAGRTLEGAPDPDAPVVRAARQVLQQQRPQEAIGQPDYAFLVRLYGQLSQERWEDALGGAERLQTTAYGTDASLIAARAHLGAGDLRDAGRAFEALASQIHPNDPKYGPVVAGWMEALHRQGAYAELLRVADTHRVPASAIDLRTAVALAQANEGRTEAAERTLEGVLNDDPNYTPALTLRSQLGAIMGP